MNVPEAGQLLTMLTAVDRREVDKTTATAWAWALADVPAPRALEAAQRIIRTGSGYVDIQAIRRELKAMQPAFERDVRSAKARGLVPAVWDARTPLPIEIEQRLRDAQAEDWAHSNDTPDQLVPTSQPAPALGVTLQGVPA